MLNGFRRRFLKDRRLYHRLGKLYGLLPNALMGMVRLFGGIDAETALFSSFNARSYNDNPRCLSEALHARRPQTKIVWLLRAGEAARDKLDLPPYVKIVKPVSFGGLVALARARVVVDNFNKHFYLSFPAKGQIYIQTWHADRAFKKVGFDCEGRYESMIEERASLVPTGSDYGDMQARSAFHYAGRLLRCGLPRNDILFRDDPAEKAAIRRRIGISAGERLLLYAPTFRDSALAAGRAEAVRLDLSRVLDAFEARTGEKWRCLIRAHYQSCGLSGAGEDARMTDVTACPEMSELMCVADALLTDYSSCAGDFILTGRPVFLYQDDLEEYSSRERGLYFDMKDSPYRVAHTQAELEELIAADSPERARENDEAILAFYGTTERGGATAALTDYIEAHLGAQNRKAPADAGLPDDDLNRPLSGGGRWRVPFFEGRERRAE